MEVMTSQTQSHKRVVGHEMNCLWTIENFSLFMRTEKVLTSQAFFIPDDDRYRWYLKIECKLDETEGDELIAGLFFCSSEIRSIVAVYMVNLLNNYKTAVSQSSLRQEEFICNKVQSIAYKLDDFLYTLTDDVLILDCILNWKKHDIFTRSGPVTSPNLSYRPSLLADDLSKMRDNCEFNDVVVVANDGIEFRASKFMLVARSPVFAAMFEHETKEKLEAKIKIEDMDSNTVKAMLDFIYAVNVDKEKCEIEDLLAAADKYDINALKSFCEVELMKKLNSENVKHFLLLADRYGVRRLKERACEFIKLHMEDES